MENADEKMLTELRALVEGSPTGWGKTLLGKGLAGVRARAGVPERYGRRPAYRRVAE